MHSSGKVELINCSDADEAARIFWSAVERMGLKLTAPEAAPAAVAVPDDLAEPTPWMLVEDLVQAEVTKNRLHQEYMGKAMPEDVHQRFERLRDERVPAIRAQVYARLAATPAAVEGAQHAN